MNRCKIKPNSADGIQEDGFSAFSRPRGFVGNFVQCGKRTWGTWYWWCW